MFIVFVTTASDPFESSYACYWDELRETYLGDLFSVMWMHEAEKVNFARNFMRVSDKCMKHI